jgi:hypothetical protein
MREHSTLTRGQNVREAMSVVVNAPYKESLASHIDKKTGEKQNVTFFI